MKDVVRSTAFKWAVKNAVDHGGKADFKRVINKVIGELPEIKQSMKEYLPIIRSVVGEVNQLSLSEQRKILEEKYPEFLEEREERKGLPELPGAVPGKVVMRLAPFPSGPLHIGNLRQFIINDEYVKKYGGKLYLVFDDTIGSEEKPILPEAYEMIEDGCRWLGIEYHEKVYKSDRMNLYYEYGEKLLREGHAYVCTCLPEVMRENRRKGIACSCRERSIEENLEFWKRMFDEFSEGEAVVRLKTDMKHPNPAFRDRVLFRISEREHPRVGDRYRVWPLLEMTWAVDNMLLGMTHIIRGKDLMMETMMERFIWDLWNYDNQPVIIHQGRVKLEGIKTSKSYTRKMIESGEYQLGWKDPRTWSTESLRERGILPESIREFIVYHIGVSENDITVPVETLYTINRRKIDPISKRIFGMFKPVEITVKNAPGVSVELKFLPDGSLKKHYSLPEGKHVLFVDESDISEEFRLKDLYNVRKDGNHFVFAGFDVKKELPKVQWVVRGGWYDIIMSDGSIRPILCEEYMNSVKPGEMIQLERIGFARYDGSRLWFAHP